MTVSLLDTSFMVRYLSNDPPRMAAIAAEVIDGSDELGVTLVGIVETAFVLSKNYQLGRQELVDVLVEFVQRENIHTLGVDKALVIQALLLCRPSHRVSFADAAMWAEARAAGVMKVYTFDRRFPSQEVQLDQGR